MTITRRVVAIVASVVLLGAGSALPAQAAGLGDSGTAQPNWRFCDYIPFFPGCYRAS